MRDVNSLPQYRGSHGTPGQNSQNIFDAVTSATTLAKAKEPIGCSATVVATFADAQEQIRVTIPQQELPQTEQQTAPECDQVVRPRGHPSNYPPNVDVRPALQRVTPTGSDTV